MTPLLMAIRIGLWSTPHFHTEDELRFSQPVLKPPLIKGKIRCLNTSKEYTYSSEVCQKLMPVDRPVKWAKLGAVPMKFF
jgi:hypothetical protein